MLETVVALKIKDLTFDWRLYPRFEMDVAVVARYAAAMRCGVEFPPVRVGVFKGQNIVVDGLHRIRAREQLEIDYVDAVVRVFESEAALFAECVSLNSAHGKGFTGAELKANIRRLERYEFNVDEIVALTHVPASEFRREHALPFLVLTSPSGKKISVGHTPDPNDLVEFKNALKVCARWAESRMIPIENAETLASVLQCFLGFGKVLSNA